MFSSKTEHWYEWAFQGTAILEKINVNETKIRAVLEKTLCWSQGVSIIEMQSL